MREAAKRSAPVPGADIAWEPPSSQEDISVALRKLANLPTAGPDIVEQSLQAMLAVGLTKPKLPTGHG